MQDIPFPFHPPHHWKFYTLSFDELPGSWSSLNHSVTEGNFTTQQCHSRPIQEFDAFVRRVVARIVQIPRMIQSSRCKVAVTVPDHKVRIRADLDRSLLRIHSVQLRRIL
jgi:hypothetical protein